MARTALISDTSLADRNSVPVHDICRLLELCLIISYFSIDKFLFKQTHCTAIGADLTVTVANLTIEHIEQKTSFVREEAEDVYFVMCTIDVSLRLLRLIGLANISIRSSPPFNSEWNLQFLNISAKKTADKLTFLVHTRPTQIGRYLNVDSYQYTTRKVLVLASLFKRSMFVCSTEESLQAEVRNIKADLQNNGCSKRFINRIHKKLRHPSLSRSRILQPSFACRT